MSDYGCFKVKKVVVVEDPVPLVVRKGKGKSKEEEAEKVVGPQEGKGDDLDMLHEVFIFPFYLCFNLHLYLSILFLTFSSSSPFLLGCRYGYDGLSCFQAGFD